jgi:hypothetical protein
MKNNLLSCICFVLLFSCKTNKDEITTPETSKTKSNGQVGTEAASKPYQNMPMMLTDYTRDIAGTAATLQQKDLINKVKSNAYDWQYFDAEYDKSAQLTALDKQYYGYIILAVKDLIGEVPGPGNDAKKSKYINELVNTSYRGYCVLYHAMLSLTHTPDNQALIQSWKNKILSDYEQAADIKSQLTLDLSSVKDAVTRRTLEKLRENYSYTDAIKEL